ncbi:MAG: hypothetical protein ACM3XN_04810 [Chloroflexota bacterium]
MGDGNRSLLCPKDRDMVEAGLLAELRHRIEQLGVPGVDDCLTLLSMLGKLVFEQDDAVNRQLTHLVMPLLKDGLGRLVERFCALEPGESDSECLSEAIQNYAKAISLIANWKFAEVPPATRSEEQACCAETQPECCPEEEKPADEPCCGEDQPE